MSPLNSFIKLLIINERLLLLLYVDDLCPDKIRLFSPSNYNIVKYYAQKTLS